MYSPSPTRRLRAHPDIDQLRRQARELLTAYRSGTEAAKAEVEMHFRDANPSTFALHDAQLVIARAYGFESWPKLKAHVDGVTITRLCDAVRDGDIPQVRAMLNVRPELANLELPGEGQRPLHFAIYRRSSELVRILMEKGADAQQGIWPNRDATSAFILARERGYDELVQIILDQESRHPSPSSIVDPPAELRAAVQARDEAGMIAFLERNPAFINLPHDSMAPLHLAAALLWESLLLWLLDHGADVNLRDRTGPSPLEFVGRLMRPDSEKRTLIASILRSRGAEMTARAAIALGDADWIRARHAEATLVDTGLLEFAVHYRRPEMLALLLDLGFDPNGPVPPGNSEEVRRGGPLLACARKGAAAMARMLLERGADPNAHGLYEWSPLYEAYTEKNSEMIQLLTSFGAYLNAPEVGYTRQVEIARKMLAGEIDSHSESARYSGISTEEQFLYSGANAGDPEIVRLALDYIDWPRDDPRWCVALGKILPDQARWNDEQRKRYVAAFRLILNRCSPDLHSSHGRTILHEVIVADFGDGVELATLLLDAAARTDVRDDLLKSTPLGWACRWGRVGIAKLLLERGADPLEADAEAWATPKAWAEKMKRDEVLMLLRNVTGT